MSDPTNDIAKELSFIENAMLNHEDYSSTGIEKRIDNLFELTIKRSEIDKAANQNYLSDFFAWKRKMGIPSKKQSAIFKEILLNANYAIRDSKRVLKGKKSLGRYNLSDARFAELKKEFNSTFEEMKALIPEGAALQFRKELIDLHYKRQSSFLKSTFLTSTLSFIISISFFFLSYYLASSLEEKTISRLGHELVTPQKLFLSACLYFFFDKLIEKVKESIKWQIINKSFKDLKNLANLVFYGDQSIIQSYTMEIEKAKKEFDSAINAMKDLKNV